MNKIICSVLEASLLLIILFVCSSYADSSSISYADGFVFPVIKDESSDPDEFVFNKADPIRNGWTGNGVGVNANSKLKGHLGQDYVLAKGNAAGKRVYAAADGVVEEVMNYDEKYGWCDKRSHGWGRVIVIKHEAPLGAFFNTDGSIVSETYIPKDSRHPGSTEKNPSVVYTLYGHLSKQDLEVRPGDKVKKGQPIARIGSSAEVSEFPAAWTPHLHFEIKSQEGFDEGVWKSDGSGSLDKPQACEALGIGSGYSFISNYAPERYDPKVFIGNNVQLDQDKIIIESKKGTVTTNNFLKIFDSDGSGSYSLAMKDNYHITYYRPDNGFQIAILTRSAKTGRKEAEQALIKILDITEKEACGLFVTLSVPFSIDPALSGRNYGLSFCPDGISFDGLQIAEQPNPDDKVQSYSGDWDANKVALEFWNAHLSKCGDSYYYYPIIP
ncbi:MAG: M23 family metallopeptidase [Bacteroidetes bacterium]|nr:M23 family metallopeptidase [Bacteroidota bacterium]